MSFSCTLGSGAATTPRRQVGKLQLSMMIAIVFIFSTLTFYQHHQLTVFARIIFVWKSPLADITSEALSPWALIRIRSAKGVFRSRSAMFSGEATVEPSSASGRQAPPARRERGRHGTQLRARDGGPHQQYSHFRRRRQSSEHLRSTCTPSLVYDTGGPICGVDSSTPQSRCQQQHLPVNSPALP